MSSSTSSFRTELKVIALVVLALAASEVAVRRWEKWSSYDLKVAATAEGLGRAGGLRVLILGNSLVREDVSMPILEEELTRLGAGPLTIRQISPLDTTVGDWYYVFKHHFVDAGRYPDVLVICFARNLLQDNPLRRALVARYYSSLQDIPQIFADDVRDFDARADFLLSRWSAAYVYRTGVKRRALAALIPYYRESALLINEAVNQATNERKSAQAGVSSSVRECDGGYCQLGRLIGAAKEHGVRVVLVAAPIRSAYSIDTQLAAFIEKAGVDFIDSRAAEGLGEGSYADSMHMNSTGATVYTRYLARELAPYLK